jgi:hypothetical protein
MAQMFGLNTQTKRKNKPIGSQTKKSQKSNKRAVERVVSIRRQSARLQNVAATDLGEDRNKGDEAAREDVRSQEAGDEDQGSFTSRDENPIATSALDSASRPRATQAEHLQATTNPNLLNPATQTSLMSDNTDSTHVDRVKQARLNLLNLASSNDNNESKLRAGLKVFQTQSAAQNSMSLDDPTLLAVGLTDSQLDKCIEMFIALPRATRSEDKTSLHNIPTLGINFSKKDAMALVSFSTTTTRKILVSQVVDESAKFTIGNKLVSMSKQIDKEPMFFDNWYDNWDLKTLAYWLKRLYSQNSLNGKTIEEELHSYQFELESPAMDLKSSDRTGEDKKFSQLHSIQSWPRELHSGQANRSSQHLVRQVETQSSWS